MDDGGVAVVEPDAELLAQVDAVELLAQGLVVRGVEVQAADVVFPVDRVRVALHHGPQARAQDNQIGGVELVLPLMTIADIHVGSLFSLAAGGSDTEKASLAFAVRIVREED